MRFEKRLLANETKSIWPPGLELVQGRWVNNLGLVIKFTGKPPICDTTMYAKERADWEEQTRKLPQGDKKAKEARIKELDDIIIEFIETHDEYRSGFIFPEKTMRQRLLEQNQMVCPHCTDEDKPFVAGNAEAFAEHLESHQKPAPNPTQYMERDEKGRITRHVPIVPDGEATAK